MSYKKYKNVKMKIWNNKQMQMITLNKLESDKFQKAKC